jgi:ribonuclease HII
MFWLDCHTMLFPYFKKGVIEAGCDEAGRGCLAGPVAAAAVILPVGYRNEEFDDSKKLTADAREALAAVIKRDALDWAVAFIWPGEIDKINILNASFRAMHQALDKLRIRPEQILVDGNRFEPYHSVAHTCIVEGDGQFMSIAAASILAKHERDVLMADLHRSFPAYNWEQNKGYPTLEHRKAIIENGFSTHHRLSFKLLPDPNQLSIFDL